MISSETKEPFSIVIKESISRVYATAQLIIKEYNLTKADKERIDKNITDEKLKRAIYEILTIDSCKH
jgi:hypothetical protein